MELRSPPCRIGIESFFLHRRRWLELAVGEWCLMIKCVGATTLEVLHGDITACTVDAIVNAANNYLWMGAGVAAAIKRTGGQVIEDEAVRQGPIPVGEAVVTGGGLLKARYVIHAAAMGQDLVTNADLIRQATISSLAVNHATDGFPMR